MWPKCYEKPKPLKSFPWNLWTDMNQIHVYHRSSMSYNVAKIMPALALVAQLWISQFSIFLCPSDDSETTGLLACACLTQFVYVRLYLEFQVIDQKY